MESSLIELVRSAAAEEGLSLSTWLAEAARARARQRAFRVAVAEHAAMSVEEAAAIAAEVRRHSIMSRPKRRRRG